MWLTLCRSSTVRPLSPWSILLALSSMVSPYWICTQIHPSGQHQSPFSLCLGELVEVQHHHQCVEPECGHGFLGPLHPATKFQWKLVCQLHLYSFRHRFSWSSYTNNLSAPPRTILPCTICVFQLFMCRLYIRFYWWTWPIFTGQGHSFTPQNNCDPTVPVPSFSGSLFRNRPSFPSPHF